MSIILHQSNDSIPTKPPSLPVWSILLTATLRFQSLMLPTNGILHTNKTAIINASLSPKSDYDENTGFNSSVIWLLKDLGVVMGDKVNVRWDTIKYTLISSIKLEHDHIKMKN